MEVYELNICFKREYFNSGWVIFNLLYNSDNICSKVYISYTALISDLIIFFIESCKDIVILY